MLLLLLCVGRALAQEEPPTFRAGAGLVRVDVQVLERNRALTGLTAADFVVYDENAPQTVEFADREKTPVQLLLVLDVSGSMRRLLSEMGAAAQQALAALDDRDEVGIVTFGGDAHLHLDLTPDRRAAAVLMREAAQDRDRKAGSSIYEALLYAANVLKEKGRPDTRHAILLLTDGGSLAFQVSDEDVLRALSAANVVVDALLPPGAKPPRLTSSNPDFTPHNVFKIAEASGGSVAPADKAAERFREMLELIRSRYTLMYKAPESAPQTFRRLRVDLSPAARARYPKAQLRARAGYYTAP